MDIFVARQPIFDQQNQVVAYELLFRSSPANVATHTDDTAATLEVLSNVFLQMGIDAITEGKRAFVNFGAALLLQQVPQLLPPEILAVEVLESVRPTPLIIDACLRLKQKGYWLVLDDFLPAEEWLPLVQAADIIKVDFRNPCSLQTRSFVHRHGHRHVRFLAEKVETRSDFQQACEDGYSLFQGYFFSRPTVLSQKSIPVASIYHLQLLRQLQAQLVDLHRFEAIVKRDMSLSYQLLTYANSAFFGFRMPVHSIRHAAALLGQQELAKWIGLATLRSISQNQPVELLRLAVIRGRQCELLAAHLRQCAIPADHFFFTGLFSLLDTFLAQPLDQIVPHLPVAAPVREALLRRPSALQATLDLAIAYERGDWTGVLQQSSRLQLATKELTPTYLEAIRWEQEFFRAEGQDP